MPLNWFFKDQLKAFDMWLRYGADKHIPPQQLPVVLQVLLSQQYRVEALKLLARFLDLGAWAVGHALTVGIFPYMLKLLQSGLKDLRQWLAFIWAKILAVEPTCQADLVKDKEQGYLYFITILNDISVSPWHKIASAFVTAAIIHNDYSPAQDVLSTNGYISICVELLSGSAIEKCRLLKLWVLIGLGRLWSGHDKARWQAIRLVAHDRVMDCLDNVVPEIRAAAMYALGCLVRNRSESDEHASSVDHEICERIATKCMYEGSVLVRAELVVALQWFIIDFEQHFANIYLELNKKIAKRKIFLRGFTDDKTVLDRSEPRRPVRRSNYGRKFS
uniref:Regulatory-associated protein of TOR 1-like n=1 Tax=Syphacia muris TaxID=451379 RepID=A0A0N5ACL7_9BILA